MTEDEKRALKNSILMLQSSNSVFKSMLQVPPPPVLAGMPPMPVQLAPAFSPLLNALKTHADEFDKLIKLVDQILDKT